MISMKTIIRFSPLLALYLILIFVFAKVEFQGDEIRYLFYAENLSQGYFVNSDDPNIRNGPGYPMYLVPFVGLNLPLVIPKISNAFLLFGAVVIFYYTLLMLTTKRMASLGAFALGLYYPMFKWITMNMSEAFSMFWICAFLYFFVKLTSNKGSKWTLLYAAASMAIFILTKLFWGNVAIASFVIASGAYLLLRRDPKIKQLIFVMGLSFLMVTPYLLYTYSLTGKVYYWATNGGEQIYWASSRLKNEFGNWMGEGEVLSHRYPNMHEIHYTVFDSLKSLPKIQRNEAFMAIGKENIKNNPKAYILNVLTNPVRLVFGYPASYRHQDLKIYFYLIIHSLFLIPFFISLIPAWINRKHLKLELLLLFGVFAIYLGGIILFTARPRHLIPVIPFILMWTAYIFGNFVEISFRKFNEINTNNS